MANILYLECNTGISGDMTVAALLDLGADREELLRVLDSIPAKGFRIEIGRIKKAGIDCCDFRVILDDQHENHDHDMEYLHGYDHICEGHNHDENGHSHDHICEGHNHDENGHSHDHICEGHNHDENGHSHDHICEGHNHDENGHSHDHICEGHNHDENGHPYEHICEEHNHDENGHSHDHICEEHVHSEHGHDHHHGDAISHDHHHDHIHPHEHRGMPEIREILNACAMTENARRIAVRIFTILAEAESKAHNVPVDEVHFHEVGAVDSIVDIVAAAVCLDNLGITEVIIPKLCEGTGSVRCQHGILSIPVPAVANIMKEYELPVQFTDIRGELVTPTGAAIAAAVRTAGKLPETFRIRAVGMGAGKRSYERPSILRAMLIEPDAQEKDVIYKLESNIDDCTGEALGFVMERLLEAGARDVHYTPVYMKKNRPAWQLNVICGQEDIERLERIIFRETTTIGIRRVEMERTCLKREQISLQTEFGEAGIKVCEAAGQKRFYPEYESVARICREYKLPYHEVYDKLVRCCEQQS